MSLDGLWIPVVHLLCVCVVCVWFLDYIGALFVFVSFVWLVDSSGAFVVLVSFAWFGFR